MKNSFYEPDVEFEGINNGENGCIGYAINAMLAAFLALVGGICFLTVKDMPPLPANIAKKFFNEDWSEEAWNFLKRGE